MGWMHRVENRPLAYQAGKGHESRVKTEHKCERREPEVHAAV